MTNEELKNLFGSQFRVIRVNTVKDAEDLIAGLEVMDADGNKITMTDNDIVLAPDDTEERIAALELRLTALENK